MTKRGETMAFAAESDGGRTEAHEERRWVFCVVCDTEKDRVVQPVCVVTIRQLAVALLVDTGASINVMGEELRKN